MAATAVREHWARGERSVTTDRLGYYRVSGDKIVECASPT